ncbi:hypothetical protein FBU30_010095 [Linnemannia zychae]|nr:hypothetical protein FBU30_010095 [Linnemannia zychae]
MKLAKDTASGHHVQGLPTSALVTVDDVLNCTLSNHSKQSRHEDVDRYNVADSGETDEDDHDKHRQIDNDHKRKSGMGGQMTRAHPLGQEPKVPITQPQHHIRLAETPMMTMTTKNKERSSRTLEMSPDESSKLSHQHRTSLRQEVDADQQHFDMEKGKIEDRGEKKSPHSSSNRNRGQNDNQFYSRENEPVHLQQPSTYLHHAAHYKHPTERQEDLLEMYRTKSFLSDISFERNGAGNRGGGRDSGAEKRGEYFSAMNFRQDPEMEARIVHKLDRHLLPLLGILYLFSYLDRVNIGNARLFGLEEAVHLTNGQYNIALSAFFLAYCLFELPSNWMLVRLGPRTWIPLLMLLWGGVSLALAWVTSFTGLVVARFALGTAEAGFVPGVLYYLTLFYKRSEHSFRIAIFLCFNILAGAFGGLLAAGISHLSGAWGLQGWQWIFIVESIPTLLLAILTWFIMTPSPKEATFLTEEERIYATNRIIIDTDVIPSGKTSWRQIWGALTDTKVYMICLGSMLLHIPNTGVVMFLPSLIADMGFKATTAQLLTVPPYMIAACVSLVIPWWSDRTGIRGYFAIFVPLISVFGFLLLTLAPWVWLRYLAVIFALCGMVPMSSILTSWMTNNCVGHAKRATALAMVVSAGSLASMAGTQVYRQDDAPRYCRGHMVMVVSMCLLVLNSLILRIILSRENRRRDNNQTKGLRLIQFLSEGHLNDLGDMHPNFRYTL